MAAYRVRRTGRRGILCCQPRPSACGANIVSCEIGNHKNSFTVVVSGGLPLHRLMQTARIARSCKGMTSAVPYKSVISVIPSGVRPTIDRFLRLSERPLQQRILALRQIGRTSPRRVCVMAGIQEWRGMIGSESGSKQPRGGTNCVSRGRGLAITWEYIRAA